MVKRAKLKFDNNYWAKRSNGTWTNYYNFYNIIFHDCGGYTMMHLCNTGRVTLTSTDAGKTFTEGEFEPLSVLSSEPIYIDIAESDVEPFVEKHLNFGGDKIITWEEHLHEVA